jgi:small subunit ribosomal protein S8
MVNDLVSDMLTRIRNATMVKHNFTYVFYSKLNVAILKILFSEGYIQNYIIENITEQKKQIKIILRYKGWWIKKPFFLEIKRISKPGNRVFSSYKHFQNFIDTLKHQQGIAIISTSMGVMSNIKAVKFKKGGEILCYIG